MSSYAVVTRESARPLWSGLAAFETALGGAFPDVRIESRGQSVVDAIEWTAGSFQSTSWLTGSINEALTAVYLRGDERLVYETALWLQAAIGDGVLTWDSQGIPFALSRLADVDSLKAAVDSDDESLDYRQPRDIHQR
jgi:hypothetical protein